ncbi:MAG: histidine kinase [Flavobacteriaceae bacterium]
MRKTFLFWLLLLGCFRMYSQQEHSYISKFNEVIDRRIDSLKFYTKQDTLRAFALLNLAHTAVFKSQKKQVLPYAEEGFELSKKLNYKKGICYYYSFKGGYLMSLGQLEEAILAYDSIYLLKSPFPKDYFYYCGFVEQNKGKIYQSQEKYFNALDHFFQSLTYYDKSQKTFKREENKHVVYTLIAQIYDEIGNYENATKYAQLILESDKTKTQHGFSLEMLVNIYFKQKNYTKTKEALQKLESYSNDSINIDLSYSYFEKKGALFLVEKQYDSAYHCFKKANNKIKNYPHPIFQNASLNNLSKAALSLGKIDEAKLYAEENIALAKTTQNISFTIDAYKNLAACYQAMGDGKAAYSLMNNAFILKDSLVSETHLKQMNTLNAMYEFEQNKEAISKLNAVNEKKELLNKILIGASIAILLVGFMGYRAISNRRKLQNLKISQLEKDQQIFAIEAMLQGQEDERSRIAKDLHDGLGGLLTGAKLSFATIKDQLILSETQENQFGKSLDLLDTAIADLRKVAHNLMPEALTKYGLYDALRDYCNNVQTATDIQINYQLLGSKRKLDNTTEVFIYRIIQELVTNVVKHAKASEIILQLAIETHKIVITIEDNGEGFDPKNLKNTKGSGLENIKYRLQYLNGSMDIASIPAQGTSINIELNA